MAGEKRDYYEVLGVPRAADPKAIKDAFRKLALQCHPDRDKSAGAEERFKEIAEAYAVLSDPKKRSDYDARGFAGVSGIPPEDLFGGIDFGDLFGGLGFDFGGGLVDRLFGRQRRRAGPARGPDLETEMVVSLDRVCSGGKETVRLSRPTACKECGGSGARSGTAPRRCDACGGGGQRVMSRQERASFHFQQITTCDACRGRGEVVDQPCPACRGAGQVEVEETLEIAVPAGVEDGMALRVPGHGLPGRERGVAPGDLYLVVRAAPDPRFERHGRDLWRTETIAVADAVLGTRIEVPTLEGAAEVTVPPGTQPDAVLRLRGKGLPELGGGRRGDLHVAIRVRVPESLTAEEQEIYERLRGLSRSPRRARRR
jgi:molecular chaperone DnaJ